MYACMRVYTGMYPIHPRKSNQIRRCIQRDLPGLSEIKKRRTIENEQKPRKPNEKAKKKRTKHSLVHHLRLSFPIIISRPNQHNPFPTPSPRNRHLPRRSLLIRVRPRRPSMGSMARRGRVDRTDLGWVGRLSRGGFGR